VGGLTDNPAVAGCVPPVLLAAFELYPDLEPRSQTDPGTPTPRTTGTSISLRCLG